MTTGPEIAGCIVDAAMSHNGPRGADIAFVYREVNTTGWKWGQTLSTSPVITKENPAYAEGNNLVPIPAVWTGKGGIALCIPPMNPW